MAQQATCSWQPEQPWRSHEPCPDPPCAQETAELSALCIFHLPKMDDPALAALDEDEHQDAERVNHTFRATFLKLLETLRQDQAAESWDLRGFQFPTIDLSGTVFERRILCDESRWGAGSSFAGAEFQARSWFFGATLGKECSFERANLGDGCSFERANLGDDCSFNRATLGDGCSFFGATLGDGCSFFGARLGDRCSFERATLGEGCSFERATLGDRCSFYGATLGDHCSFNRATIEDSCSFNGATLGNGCSFYEATLGDDCSFYEATLGDDCSFQDAELGPHVSFYRLRVDGRVVFDGSNGEPHGNFQGAAWFTDVVFGKDGVLIFRQTNLHEASFLGTDLAKVVFEDVHWRMQSEGSWLPRRLMAPSPRRTLWDEDRLNRGDLRRLRGESALEIATATQRRRAFSEALGANYRQLVLNYEKTRAYEAAEDFYIGEMETRRKQVQAERAGLLRGRLNVYAAYRALSWYGADLRHAVGVLLLFALGLFPLGFMLAGFAISKEAISDGIPPPEPLVVDWDWRGWDLLGWPAPAGDPSVWLWVTDYLAAVRFTLSIVSFQRDRFFVPTSDLGQYWLMLAVFVLTGQLALVLFALRRRFKRSAG